MTPLKHLETNRRNSQRSTGPKSDRGKGASSKNATKHGRAGTGIVDPDEVGQQVVHLLNTWDPSLRPFDASLIGKITIEAVRIDMAGWQAHEDVGMGGRPGRLPTKQESRPTKTWA